MGNGVGGRLSLPLAVVSRLDLPVVFWAAIAMAIVCLAALPVELGAQSAMAWSVVAILLILHQRELSPALRLMFIFLAAFLTLRYFFWRTFFTLGWHGPLSFVAAMLLYSAEVYGITNYLLGVFVNISPLERKPAPLPARADRLPKVDVLIPTYNEDPELLEVTLLAATQIRYPAGRLRVALCDDGGTVQKCNDRDPEKARAAQERHRQLQELCQRVGATYLTREKNVHAKAGNINSALQHTAGELILILDADHVPTRDILENTVGLFLQDPKLFLVQTPHFFINPDPLEKNLGTFHRMPSENEMFYSVIQKGLDFWGASFFCGSAALLRRSMLMPIGGIAGETITEDAETALELHRRGYHSAYISKPMVCGLSPETFTGFVVQRVRWAQGMVQIFLLKNPLRQAGLSIRQRLCYLTSSFFWFFSYARFVFLLAPALYLLADLKIYDANLAECLSYPIPHVIGSVLLSSLLFGRVRWVLVSELYELMQSLFTLPGILKVFHRPRAPKFMVTPKGERLDQDFVSPLAGPFYWMLALTLASLGAAVWRIWGNPVERDAVIVTMLWAGFNLLLLLGALGALFERRQTARTPRTLVDEPAQLQVDDQLYDCRVQDLSVDGAGVQLADSVDRAPLSGRFGTLVVSARALERELAIPVRICHTDRVIGLDFRIESLQQRSEIVAWVYGDSDRWAWQLERRNRTVGLWRPACYFVSLGIRRALAHARFLSVGAAQRVVQWIRPTHRTGPPVLDPIPAAPTTPTTGVPAKPGVIATVLIAASLGWIFTAAADDRVPELPVATNWSHTQRLAELIPLPGPLTLRNSSSDYTVFVPLSPRASVAEARLHLEFTNSISLLPDRSQLRVSVNELIIAQLPLRPESPSATAEIAIPTALLEPGYNRLKLSVAQHYTLECEDPSAPELWTQIDTDRSTLAVRAVLRAFAPKLSELDQIFDRKLWGPYSLTIVTPATEPDYTHLHWGSLAAQGVALRLDYKPLELRHRAAQLRQRDEPANPTERFPTLEQETLSGRDAILIGTKAELSPFLTPAMLEEITGAYLSIAPLDVDPGRTMLVISGISNHDVTMAARAFTHLSFPMPDSRSMRVSDLQVPTVPAYTARNGVYENGTYSFSQFGLTTTTMKGLSSDKATLEVWVSPDLFSAAERDVELNLHLSHGAAFRPDSVLNIFLNGRFENVLHFVQEAGAIYRGYQLKIPLRSFRAGKNTLVFQPEMMPLITGNCQAVNQQNLLVTLFDDSTISLPPAEHFVRLPDLSLFSRTGFPFTVAAHGDDLALQVASKDSATLAAAWMLMARLAQVTGTPLTNTEQSFRAIDEPRHLLLVGPKDALDRSLLIGAPAQFGAEARAPFPSLLSPQPDNKSRSWWQRLVDRLARLSDPKKASDEQLHVDIAYQAELGRIALAMEHESPLHPGKTITTITASNPSALERGVAALIQPKLWDGLQGDLAVWMPDSESVRAQRAGTNYYHGSVGPITRAQFLFSRSPWTWLCALITLVALLALVTWRLLKRFRRKHHAAPATT
jgi:cellulose synthase (UDP-forming)